MSEYPGMPKRRGLAMTIIGAIAAFVLAPGLFFGGTIIGALNATDIVKSASVQAPGASVEVKAGEKRAVLGDVGQVANDTQIESGSNVRPAPQCKVTGPDGADVPLEHSTSNVEVGRSGTGYSLSGTFTATKTGAHKVDCGVNALVLDQADVEKKIRDFGMVVVVGLIAATIVGIIGLILLIVGIVKLVNSGKERSAFRLHQQQQQWNAGGRPYGY